MSQNRFPSGVHEAIGLMETWPPDARWAREPQVMVIKPSAWRTDTPVQVRHRSRQAVQHASKTYFLPTCLRQCRWLDGPVVVHAVCGKCSLVDCHRRTGVLGSRWEPPGQYGNLRRLVLRTAYEPSVRCACGTPSVHAFSSARLATRASLSVFLWNYFGCPFPTSLCGLFDALKETDVW